MVSVSLERIYINNRVSFLSYFKYTSSAIFYGILHDIYFSHLDPTSASITNDVLKLPDVTNSLKNTFIAISR